MAKDQQITLRTGEEIKLSEKEMLFCTYYLGDTNRNGTQAAIKAGYAEKSARQTAAKLVSKTNIQKYINDQTAPILEACGVSNERIIKRIRDLAFTDLADLTDDDWNLLPKSQIRKDHQGAMGAVEIEERVLMQGNSDEGTLISRKTKYRLKDSIKALGMLAEMAGLIDKRAKIDLGDQVNKQGATINFNQINNYIINK